MAGYTDDVVEDTSIDVMENFSRDNAVGFVGVVKFANGETQVGERVATDVNDIVDELQTYLDHEGAAKELKREGVIGVAIGAVVVLEAIDFEGLADALTAQRDADA